MKKVLALVLCLIMVAAVAVSTISADEAALIDHRDVRAYGNQNHIYLGNEPVSGTKVPTIDGTVAEGEYTANWQFSKEDVATYTAVWDSIKSQNYMDNEWVKTYISYGDDTLYVALVTKDPVYVVDKDGFGLCLNLKDGGATTDAISRLCFDIDQAADGSPKIGCRYFHKQPDGSWNNPAGDAGTQFIKDIAVTYDETTSLLTAEVSFSISAQLEHWGNENEVKDAILSVVPFTYMYGPSIAGGDDTVSQGNLWSYYTGADNAEIKMNFTLDYPEISYWVGWFANIVHFCDKPVETTAAPTTTAEPTTAAPTTTAAATTKAATTVAATTVADATAAATTAAEATKGCKSTVALSALALVPMLGAAVVFGKKRED